MDFCSSFAGLMCNYNSTQQFYFTQRRQGAKSQRKIEHSLWALLKYLRLCVMPFSSFEYLQNSN